MATCLDGNPLPACDLTCEELVCRLDAADTNITNLFGRTNDINTYLDALVIPSVTDSGWTVVTTEAELKAAVLVGGLILVVGPIVLTSTLEIDHQNTWIYGRSNSAGQRASITLVGAPATVTNVIRIRATGAKLRWLEITSNNTLDPIFFPGGGDAQGPNEQLDWGIKIEPSAVVDVSDLVIEECYIHNVTIPIYMTGNGASIYADRIRIRNNRIESFSWYGIYLNWGMRNLVIEGNWIWGRKAAETHTGQAALPSESHPVAGNGIWVGDHCQRAMIRGNDIGYCDRHGIEVVNTHTNDSNSNDGIIIVGNNIHDLVTPAGNPIIRLSFGISVACGGNGCIIGWNQIRNVTAYGIELYNQTNTQGNYVVIGNRISNVIHQPGYTPEYQLWGISVNSVTGALITQNYIKRIEGRNIGGETIGSRTVGIAVEGGSATGHPGLGMPSWVGVTISDNELVDAGCCMILVHGVGTTVPPEGKLCATVKGNVMRFTVHRQYRPLTQQEEGVIIGACGTSCVVKDNILYYPNTLPPSDGYFISGFNLRSPGTVYSGHASHAPVVYTDVTEATAPFDIGGSNLSIQYTDPTGATPNL